MLVSLWAHFCEYWHRPTSHGLDCLEVYLQLATGAHAQYDAISFVTTRAIIYFERSMGLFREIIWVYFERLLVVYGSVLRDCMLCFQNFGLHDLSNKPSDIATCNYTIKPCL